VSIHSWQGQATIGWVSGGPGFLKAPTSSAIEIALSSQNMVEMISDWRVRIGISRNRPYIRLIGFKTGSKPMNYKRYRYSHMLKGLVGGVVLLMSSGIYADSGDYLYNSSSPAVDADQVSGGFQYTLASSQASGLNGAKPVVWTGEYGKLSSESVAIQESPVNDLLDRKTNNLEAGIGMGVTPLFDTYGVVRTSSNNDQSTYAVLGYLSDEMLMDDAGTVESENDGKLSYGFGVNKSSFNFEYMMSLDEQRKDISAVGMRFTSEF
jgi:hypothetical protein